MQVFVASSAVLPYVNDLLLQSTDAESYLMMKGEREERGEKEWIRSINIAARLFSLISNSAFPLMECIVYPFYGLSSSDIPRPNHIKLRLFYSSKQLIEKPIVRVLFM